MAAGKKTNAINHSRDKSAWYGCPIRFAMGIFGDKWTLLIIRDLMFKGKKHYSEFHDNEEHISTNILADRLMKLERHGIITKTKDPHKQSKFIYALSPKGVDLLPVMLAIVDWSEKYDTRTEVPQDFIQDYRIDPAAFIARMKKSLG